LRIWTGYIYSSDKTKELNISSPPPGLWYTDWRYGCVGEEVNYKREGYGGRERKVGRRGGRGGREGREGREGGREGELAR